MIVAIGKQDQGTTSLLFSDDFIGGEENRVIQRRTCSASIAPVTPAALRVVGITVVIATIRVLLKAGLGGVDLLERLLEFAARHGDILQQCDRACELDEEGLIAIGREHLVEEAGAR